MRYYRFPYREFISLIDELEPHLQSQTMRGHAILTHTQVLLALRIYASGSFQYVIGDVCDKFLANAIHIIMLLVLPLLRYPVCLFSRPMLVSSLE